ncbi:MAG: cobalt transporter CbiM [Synergistaceae bacterium]|jgi:cobalt/nickel transport system permease protein|nr:cobalt transporter CbiM [Synergistaceae bacterium]
MHISEGFLSPGVLVSGFVIAGAGVAYGLKKTDPDRIVRVSMTSSVFFLASLVNIRVGPGSAHMSLIGAMGLMLGWSSFPAVFTALLLQAALFQFGGLFVLGVNTASMASAAVMVHLLFGGAVRASGGSEKLAAAASFAAGFIGVFLGAAFSGLWLAASDPGLSGAAWALIAVHLPAAFLEGAVTLAMTAFLRRTFPDVLGMAVTRE